MEKQLEALTKQILEMDMAMQAKQGEILRRLDRLEQDRITDRDMESGGYEDQGGERRLKFETFTSVNEGEDKKVPERRHLRTGVPPIQNEDTMGLTTIKSRNLKWEYEAFKDSVSRLKLPHDYRMYDSRAGINSKDREQAAILVKSGKFIETGLKLLGEMQKNWGNLETMAELLDGIMLSMTAHMRYMQEEYNGLYVGSQYGNHTKSIFNSIQRNTSNLSPEDIEDLKTAVAITQRPQGTTHGENNVYRGGFRQTHGRFRGRSSFNHGRNNYFGYQMRSVPTMRESGMINNENQDEIHS